MNLFTNSQRDQLTLGLIAQLVEHCTGVAEVRGSNPVQAWIFFRLSLVTAEVALMIAAMNLKIIISF